MKWVYQCFGISKQAFYKRLNVFKKRNLDEQIILDLIREARKELPKTGGLKLYKTIKPHLLTMTLK
jgi:hypothetical protein